MTMHTTRAIAPDLFPPTPGLLPFAWVYTNF